MSNVKNQTPRPRRRFIKKLIDTMRFTDIDVTYKGHQNWPKILSMDILRVLVTIICDVKIDINIYQPHGVNLFFVNLLHSLGV